MKDTLEQLARLQELDSAIAALELKQGELSKATRSAEQALDTERTKFDEAHHATQEAKAATHRAEMDLSARESDIEKTTIKLNQATSNKEYSSLLVSIGVLKAQVGKIEETILLAMDEAERIAGLEGEQKACVATAEAELRAAEAAVESTRDEMQRDLEARREERGQLAGEIDERSLNLYERIRKGNRSTGAAIADVVGGYCQGCQMSVTPQQLADIMVPKALTLCRTCGRIMVFVS